MNKREKELLTNAIERPFMNMRDLKKHLMKFVLIWA